VRIGGHPLGGAARGGIEEVVLATNPNTEGDATAHYLCERLRPLGVRLSRIAYGMPLGGDLEYADHVTVGICIENRRAI
jgi:recombination protein RecR